MVFIDSSFKLADISSTQSLQQIKKPLKVCAYQALQDLLIQL